MDVLCEVEEVELENDSGRSIGGVCVTCPRCGWETESFGTGEGSVRRCLVLLREECPRGEYNYYEVDDEFY